MDKVEENKRQKEKDSLPIISPLKVIDFRTIKKGSGWWLAVVLVESWQKRNIGIYMWQRKKDGKWHRKQKFTIHTREKWGLISGAVNELIKDMDNPVKYLTPQASTDSL